MRRAAIYALIDRQGEVDRYVEAMLRELSLHAETIIVVATGSITASSRERISRFAPDILLTGRDEFNVHCYKKGFAHLGWEVLKSFDEVIFADSSAMGPVRPLSEAFEAMQEQDVDYWGVTACGGWKEDRTGCNPYGYVPPYIQSCFTVCRQHLVDQPAFADYWSNLPEMTTPNEVAGLHETYFTKHFADMGFRWKTYIRPTAEDLVNPNMLIFAPRLLLEKYACPFFSVRSFSLSKDTFLNESAGEATRELLSYLRTQTTFDVDMIWENILRTCHGCDIADALALTYVLPERRNTQPDPDPLPSVALCMHLFYPDLLAKSLRLAQRMPSHADIFVTTSQASQISVIEKSFSVLPNTVRVIKVPNRGRDVGALLIGCRDFILDYDFAMFYHDKKSLQVDPPTVGQSFAQRLEQNTLASPSFALNVIQTLMDNPRCGLLVSPEPNHSFYYPTVGNEWGVNYPLSEKLALDLNLKVPMSPTKRPLAAFGTVFWFRPASLRALFAADFTWDSFIDEDSRKKGVDGELIHAIERMYPLVAQDAGYYTATLMSDREAELEISNLRHYVRNFNAVCLSWGYIGQGRFKGTNFGFIASLRQHLARTDWVSPYISTLKRVPGLRPAFKLVKSALRMLRSRLR